MNPDSAVGFEREAQCGTLPLRSRWVTASKLTACSGAVVASSAYRKECESEKFFCNFTVGRLRTFRIPHCSRKFVSSTAESGLNGSAATCWERSDYVFAASKRCLALVEINAAQRSNSGSGSFSIRSRARCLGLRNSSATA
jgi:hypothetical protein